MLHTQSWCGFSLLVAAFALPACGGKSFDANDGGSGGTESGGNSSGATSNGGFGHSEGYLGGGGSGGGTTTGGSAQCDGKAYQDDGPANIPVRIINDTKAVLYLGPTPSCGAGELFNVADATGILLSSPALCQTTCQQLITGNISGCPPIPCPVGEVLTLQPGEDTLQLWSGLYQEDMTWTPQCRPAASDDTCQRVAAVKPGAFTFTATAGTELDCSVAFCMTCTPADTGGCTTFGGVVTGPTLSAETKVMLDGSYGLGGPGGGGAVKSVEIVFK